VAKEKKELLDKYNLAAEFVAPRLLEDTKLGLDGGFTSNSKEDREWACGKHTGL